MKVANHVRYKLQCHANRLLSLEYDGSGDFWHYVETLGDEWGINIYEPEDDGKIKICAYLVDANGDTIYDNWVELDTDALPLKICNLRLKVKDAVSCD